MERAADGPQEAQQRESVKGGRPKPWQIQKLGDVERTRLAGIATELRSNPDALFTGGFTIGEPKIKFWRTIQDTNTKVLCNNYVVREAAQ